MTAMANPTDNKSDTKPAGPSAAEIAAAQKKAEETAANAQQAREQADAAEREAETARLQAGMTKPPSATRARSDSEGDNIITLKQSQVIVHRNDLTGVPTTVFEHEVPILKALHGDDFVQILKTEDVKVANFDANTEFARMKRKYKNPNAADRDVVGMVYGNDPKRLAEAAGVPFKASDARKPKASTQKPAKKGKVIGRNR